MNLVAAYFLREQQDKKHEQCLGEWNDDTEKQDQDRHERISILKKGIDCAHDAPGFRCARFASQGAEH